MPHLFTDNAGRDWPLRINADCARRVKAMTGLNLVDLAKSRAALLQVTSEPAAFCGLLFAIVAPQAGQLHVSPDDFAAAFVGERVTRDAMQALAAAIGEAYPRQRLKAVNRAIRDLEAAARRGRK